MNKYTITGYGLCLPEIYSTTSLWENLINSNSDFSQGMNTITLEMIERILSDYPYIPKKKLKHSDLQSIFHFISVKECLEKANLKFLLDKDEGTIERNKIGVVSGSMFAQMNFGIKQVSKIVNERKTNISPYTGMAFYYGANVGEISCLLKTRGENCAVLGGTSLVLDGVDVAETMIDFERNDVVLVGGGENVNYDMIRTSLMDIDGGNLKNNILPFNKDLKGVRLTNGAAIFSLERTTTANKRGVYKYANISRPVSVNCLECTFDMNASLIESYSQLVDLLLAENNLTKDDITVVIPTGESVNTTDYYEAMALQRVFEKRKHFVYTPRSVIGNSMGVSCAVDIITALLMIEHREVPAFPYVPKLGSEELENIFVVKRKRNIDVENILIIHKNWTDGKITGVIVSTPD